ncbi:MAG TPA: hypothetical protein VFK70_00920 [Vicinamibacteria bacterium]|nr:hypothetical protein [Vicinamibacteria bacterium]
MEYARVTDHDRLSLSETWGQGIMGEWGLELSVGSRTRAFVGGRAGILGNGEGGGLGLIAVTLGVNLGLQ